jgi:hypothetical protein
LAADSIDLWLWCERCHHYATVPIAEAIARHGAGTCLQNLKARCGECGSPEVDIRPDWGGHGPGVVTRHTE